MASTGNVSLKAVFFGPSMAIFQHDLRALWRSRLIRLWLAASALLTLLLVMSGWTQMSDASVIASLLFPYLVLPWFFVVIVLAVTPVSGAQAGSLADGILSRPVTRHGYLLATWAARLVTVLGVYLAVVVPAILVVTLAHRPVPGDTVSVYGIVTSLFVVGLVLGLIVSLGFFAGTVLQRSLLAVVVLVFAWYPVNLVLSVFSLEEFSPISLSQAIPTQLRQNPFAEDGAPGTQASRADIEAVANLLSNFGKVFAASPPARSKDGFFETDQFEDFSLFRVTLGYALPALAAIALAAFAFYRRDL